MRGIRRSWLARTAAFVLVLPVAACSDDTTAPKPDVDPAATQAALEQVLDQYFNDNPGLSSLEIFSAAIDNALPPVASVKFALQPDSPNLFGLANRLGQSMRAVYARGTSLPMLMANVPPEVLGTTFVYDPGAGQYVASDRTGAPDDVVRFILYDGVTTLNEVGYFDFTDKSTFGNNSATVDIKFQVFITAVSTTTPVVEYVVTGTASNTGGTLAFDGFLSDGIGQLDFDFDISGSEATGYSAGFALSAGGISVTLDIIETTTFSQTIEASVRAGTDEIRFLIMLAPNGDIQGGSGIFFNDGSGEALVATFSGNIQDEPTVTNTAGNPLTQQELVVLDSIFAAMGQAFLVMEELFAFGLALVGVAFFF